MISPEPSRLARLSMSLPAELFRQLDLMVEERGLPSRSQLIAELIRHALAEHEALTRPEDMLAGTITIVYAGGAGRVRQQLAETQVDYLKEVISSQHVFLEEDQSLEVLLVHPGGPFWRNKDPGAWSIPKGEYPDEEDAESAARRPTNGRSALLRRSGCRYTPAATP